MNTQTKKQDKATAKSWRLGSTLEFMSDEEIKQLQNITEAREITDDCHHTKDFSYKKVE